MLQILQIVAAALTILTGLVALVRPLAITGFTGLKPEGGRGITEIRVILGALFIALGATPLVLDEPVAYLMLGITYLSLAVVRAISIIVDKSAVGSNILSVVVEIVLGVVLVL
jgi:hypothetical protein